MNASQKRPSQVVTATDVWDRVDRRGEDECWPWTGSISRALNRGRVNWRGRYRYAYRVTWELANGVEMPDHLEARHTCDNPICVNPSHILPGTHADNMRDMRDRGRNKIPPPRLGDDNHTVTVDTATAKRAVEEYLSGGQSQKAVAEKYGVSTSALGRWVRGELRTAIGTQPFSPGNSVHARGGLMPCGTRAAYSRHLKAGETPCDECREVNSEYMRQYKQARRRQVAA